MHLSCNIAAANVCAEITDLNLNFQSFQMSFKNFSLHELPNLCTWKSTDYKWMRVNLWKEEDMRIFVYLLPPTPIFLGISRYSVLFQYPARPQSLLRSLCEDWNLLWTVWGRLDISYNIHWTIFTQSHSWKIFSDMNVYRKRFREERKGWEGGEGKIIQTGRGGVI